MTRLGTALERRRETPPPAGGGLSRRVAQALERRGSGGAFGHRLTGALDRRSPGEAAGGGPLADRLLDALERGLARALERRLGDTAGSRAPGAAQQRLVALLERRLPAVRRQTGDVGWSRRAVGRTTGGRLAGRRPATVRALVVSLLARGIVRALARLVGIFGRALASAPIRRFAGLLIRRALRAGPSAQAGILAFLLGLAALLARRLARLSRGRWEAIVLAIRLARRLATVLGHPTGRLLRAAAARLGREVRRAVASRRG